jgi:hypothetical protein
MLDSTSTAILKNISAPKIIDITGKRFGRRVALSRCPERSRYGSVMWLTRCDCGVERTVCGHHLRKGKSNSCGCLSRERFTKHGLSRTRAYRSWLCMMARCFNPRDKSYADYGGRGVTVCERYLSVENFFADMGERQPGMSLDRINPNGNYEPDNVRWATPAEQAANRRRPRRRRKRSSTAALQRYLATRQLEPNKQKSGGTEIAAT